MADAPPTIAPFTLTGKAIRLEPLTEAHIPDLEYACKDPPDSRRTMGLARNHILLHDGTPRSSALYSILDNEWPAVEIQLENLMARAGG